MVSGRCCRRKGEIRARRSLKTLFVAHMSQAGAENVGFPHQDGALATRSWRSCPAGERAVT